MDKRPPELVSMLPPHQHLALRRMQLCEFEGHQRREVVHDHSALVIHLSGTTRFWMGVAYTLERGDVLLVPEGVPHCAAGRSEGEALGVICCTGCFGGSAWGERLGEMFDAVRQGQVAVRRLGEEELERVERLLAQLERELEGGSAHRELMIDGVMSQAVALLLRAVTVALPEGERMEEACPAPVAAALRYIEQHASQAISLREVARAVGRSPAHLATLTRRHTGRTVVEWITHGRMAQARRLLLSSEEGIEGIAERVGFASASHFHRTFRRLHQLTPGEWRQAHRGRA